MTTDRQNSSSAPKVEPIFGSGGNESCVEHLRELLAQAERGEVIGFVCVSLRSDFTASQTIAGSVGGSMMVGQLRIAEHDLLNITMKAREG